MTKKVLFTVSNDICFDQRMHRICSSLIVNGFDVTIIGRTKISSIPLQNQLYKQKRIYCFFQKGKFFYLEYNLKLFFFLLFQKADIYSAVDLDTLFPCYLISKIKSKTCVYDAHEYFTEVPEVVRRPWIKFLWLALEKFIVPKLKYQYTVCESIAELFNEKYKTNFIAIRNTPTLEKIENGLLGPVYENSILYQGALNEGRGLENLFYAIKELDVTLYLAGDGDIKKKLEMLSVELNIAKKVNFLGFVQPHELKMLTKKMKIGVGVSENLGLSYYYSLNNKFFDYIHAEIPSIGNNWPEYNKVNERYRVALLCEANVEDLKENILKLLTNSNLYYELKGNCKIAKTELNWAIEEKKLIQLYSSIV